MARAVCPDADTIETGLRSREKLHEDLVHPDECTIDDGDYWTLTPGEASTGMRYSSKMAWGLSRDAFLVMLREADNV